MEAGQIRKRVLLILSMCCGMAAVYFLLLLLPYISSFWGWYQEYWAGCHDDLSGRTLESEKHFVKALELTGLNLSDQRVRVTLQALDILYAGHRRFDRCQKIVLYCLQADEASADRVNLAKDSLGAGKLYRKMRRYDESTKYLKQALALYDSHTAAHDVLQALDVLAWVTAQRGDFTRARAICQQETELLATGGPQPICMRAWPAATLAWIAARENAVDEEKRIISVAFDAWQGQSGESDYYHVIPLNLLGNLACDAQMYRESEFFFDAADRIARATLSFNNPFRADIWSSKAKLLQRTGRPAEAADWLRQADVLRHQKPQFLEHLPVPALGI